MSDATIEVTFPISEVSAAREIMDAGSTMPYCSIVGTTLIFFIA
jgi:hypothetical protein